MTIREGPDAALGADHSVRGSPADERIWLRRSDANSDLSQLRGCGGRGRMHAMGKICREE